MKIIKGDQVLIISGKDKGRKGSVLKALPKEGKILVEGINVAKKHNRPKKSGEKGQVVEMPKMIDSSNAKIICTKCGKSVRVGYNDKKNRICKKCNQEI